VSGEFRFILCHGFVIRGKWGSDIGTASGGIADPAARQITCSRVGLLLHRGTADQILLGSYGCPSFRGGYHGGVTEYVISTPNFVWGIVSY